MPNERLPDEKKLKRYQSTHERDLPPVKTISCAEPHVCSILLTFYLCDAAAVKATSSYSAASHCYTINRVKEKRAHGPIAYVPEMPHSPAATVS
jgi:hypothetical protein